MTSEMKQVRRDEYITESVMGEMQMTIMIMTADAISTQERTRENDFLEALWVASEHDGNSMVALKKEIVEEVKKGDQTLVGVLRIHLGVDYL